ncbi:MAG: oligosaccharide flippase family protein, partial [bacterium]|nr:oligosaccharide flippase family protein [bacterium]
MLCIPISLVSQGIIPRGLGPKNYGDFNYLTNFFSQILNFLGMGTSIGFYTKLSQKPNRNKLVVFYLYFIGAVSFLVLVLVIIAQITGLYKKILPDQGLLYIYLAVFLGILIWINEVMNQMVDAYGLTVSAEIRKSFQKIAGLILIGALFIYNKINLFNFFLYNFILLFISILIFISLIRNEPRFNIETLKLKVTEIKKHIIEFYEYSHPLFIYAVLSAIVNIFDRWLLQVFGGSIKQGFFALSYQIGSICFLFAGAMTPLINREFSIAYDKQDVGTMADLFRKHIPLLCSITAFIACFAAVNADKITLILGGGKFRDATVAVCIMSFYPIHQAYGQLTGAVFYSTGQTKLYRNIGLFFLIIGLPMTYFMIAPKNNMGLDAGATGLAIKTVLINVLSVNVLLYYSARFLRLIFWKFVVHQIIV